MNKKKDLIFITFLTLLTIISVGFTSYIILQREQTQRNVKAAEEPEPTTLPVSPTDSPTPEISIYPTRFATPSATLSPTQ